MQAFLLPPLAGTPPKLDFRVSAELLSAPRASFVNPRLNELFLMLAPAPARLAGDAGLARNTCWEPGELNPHFLHIPIYIVIHRFPFISLRLTEYKCCPSSTSVARVL